MLGLMSRDIIELIVRSSDIRTFRKLRLINHEFYTILQSSAIYYHFTRRRFALRAKNLIKCNIDYCTNADCPNKIHEFNRPITETALIYSDLNLDLDLMLEYREILNSFSRQDIRIDKTMTCEFPIIRKICNIRGTPYCEDCMTKHLPNLYQYIHTYNKQIGIYLGLDMEIDLNMDVNALL